jgi:hypothetical protein
MQSTLLRRSSTRKAECQQCNALCSQPGEYLNNVTEFAPLDYCFYEHGAMRADFLTIQIRW